MLPCVVFVLLLDCLISLWLTFWLCLCLYVLLHTTGVSFHNIYSSVSISSLLHPLSAVYSDLVSACFFLLIQSLFLSLMFSNTIFYTFCISTLQAQTKTCSLLTSLLSFRAIISLIIFICDDFTANVIYELPL